MLPTICLSVFFLVLVFVVVLVVVVVFSSPPLHAAMPDVRKETVRVPMMKNENETNTQTCDDTTAFGDAYAYLFEL